MKLSLNIFLFGLFTSSCFAQLTIDNTTYTKTQLVTNILAPSGNGLTISNVTTKGVYNVSSRYQIGYFSTAGSVQTDLGMASGVLLTSGNTSEIPLSPLSTHPGSAAQVSRNFVSGTTGEIRSSNAASGQDADAAVLASPQSYFNASVLEFDFIPANTNMSFRYVFGSEEYMDDGGFINYNCSSYNDKFAFLISGPGISSAAGFTNNAENIAILSNGSSVSINSVNNGVVGSSGGAPGSARCLAANPSWVQNSVTSEFKGIINGINFNGNTKVLTASKSGLTAGATYHIKLIITDVNDGAYDSGVFLEANSFLSPIVLPVEINSFVATCEENKINIDWKTLSERNNQFFYLEKSVDENRFESIAKLNGAGNSNSIQNYSYSDFTKTEGRIYYRLKQVDFNGNISFSSIISTENYCEKEINSIINIYPNPSSTNVNLDLNIVKSEDINYAIINTNGQIIYEQTIKSEELKDGRNKLEIPTINLEKGIYFIQIKLNKTIETKKLVLID